MSNENGISRETAKKALASVKTMQSAGYRRAVPQRWFGAGVAFFVASMFAVYALQDPYPYIVFPILGLALFIAISREQIGAYARDFPSTNAWALPVCAALLVTLFFASIYFRRAYDIPLLSVGVGVLVGLLIFYLSEDERRSYINKAAAGGVE